MALDLGTLVAKLKVDTTGFDGPLDRSQSKFSAFGGTIAKAAKLAGAATLAGIGAAAVGGVKAFAGLQSGMNEVFTLMPGMSQDAMDAMTGDVKDFSKEFGVLPDEVVPALYQSLSAGVPPGNVFEFLETAQKAAKGGVTDLTTAVDGISSVVNSYGEDVVGATKASDLMFTAVKLGKTNFEELSGSLYNVVPTASALGVEFGDVTAALAAMTAQGVPTSVATTQMRQLFVELSKAGGKTSETFKEVAGVGFKQFIAEGGNVQEALQLLEGHAKKSGLGINDLFGSVEAGSAALSLTGKGTDKFTDSLAGMQDSAGATNAAFEQMDQGLSASWDKIKAAGAVALIDIGESLEPLVARFSAFAEVAIPKVAAAIGMLPGAIDQVGASFASTKAFVEEHRTGLSVLAGFIAAVYVPSLVAMGVASTVNAVKAAGAWLLQTAAAVGYRAVHSLTVAMTVAGWVLMGAQAMAGAVRMAAAWLIALGPIGLVIAAVVAVVAAVVMNWDRIKAATAAAWGWVTSKTAAAWAAIKAGVTTAVNAVKSVVTTVFAAIKAAITTYVNAWRAVITTVWNAIKTVVTGAVNAVRSVVTSVFGAIRGVVTSIMGAIRSAIQAGWNAAKAVVTGAVGAIRSGVTGAFNAARSTVQSVMQAIRSAVSNGIGQVVSFFSGLLGKIKGALAGAGSALFGMGQNIVQGLIGGLRSMAGAVASTLVGLLPGPLKKFAGKLGLASPSKLFRQYGEWTGEGYVLGLQDMQRPVESAVANLAVVPDLKRPRSAAAAAGRTGAAGSAAGTAGAGEDLADVLAELRAMRQTIARLPRQYRMAERTA